MILADSHSHSDHSRDSHAPAADMALGAEQCGLQLLYFSEHFEFHYRETPDDPLFTYLEDHIFAPHDPLPGHVVTPLAIEIGEMHEGPDICRDLLARHPYEFVLGSLHRLPGRKGFLSSSYTGRQQCEYLFDSYLEYLLLTAAETDYDALAHIDYPLRYFYSNAGVLMHLEDRLPKLEEILSTVVRRGKALELNTAILRKGYPTMMGDALALFRSLGGKYVTIGSDAHAPQHLAYAFAEAEAVTKAAGFDHYTVYRHRQPHLIPFSAATLPAEVLI